MKKNVLLLKLLIIGITPSPLYWLSKCKTRFFILYTKHTFPKALNTLTIQFHLSTYFYTAYCINLLLPHHWTLKLWLRLLAYILGHKMWQTSKALEVHIFCWSTLFWKYDEGKDKIFTAGFSAQQITQETSHWKYKTKAHLLFLSQNIGAHEAVFVLRWAPLQFWVWRWKYISKNDSPISNGNIGTVMSWLFSDCGQDSCPTKPENTGGIHQSQPLFTHLEHHGRYVLITSLMGLLHIGQHALICLFSFIPQSLHRHMCPQV